jgi:hypothetical protein
MEWDLPGGVAPARVEEAEALAGWVETALELAPAESVSVRVVERRYNIRQAHPATI